MPFPHKQLPLVVETLRRWRETPPCFYRFDNVDDDVDDDDGDTHKADLLFYYARNVQREPEVRALITAALAESAAPLRCIGNIKFISANLTADEDVYVKTARERGNGTVSMFSRLVADVDAPLVRRYQHLLWMEPDVAPVAVGWLEQLLERHVPGVSSSTTTTTTLRRQDLERRFVESEFVLNEGRERYDLRSVTKRSPSTLLVHGMYVFAYRDDEQLIDNTTYNIAQCFQGTETNVTACAGGGWVFTCTDSLCFCAVKPVVYNNSGILPVVDDVECDDNVGSIGGQTTPGERIYDCATETWFCRFPLSDTLATRVGNCSSLAAEAELASTRHLFGGPCGNHLAWCDHGRCHCYAHLGDNTTAPPKPTNEQCPVRVCLADREQCTTQWNGVIACDLQDPELCLCDIKETEALDDVEAFNERDCRRTRVCAGNVCADGHVVQNCQVSKGYCAWNLTDAFDRYYDGVDVGGIDPSEQSTCDYFSDTDIKHNCTSFLFCDDTHSRCYCYREITIENAGRVQQADRDTLFKCPECFLDEIDCAEEGGSVLLSNDTALCAPGPDEADLYYQWGQRGDLDEHYCLEQVRRLCDPTRLRCEDAKVVYGCDNGEYTNRAFCVFEHVYNTRSLAGVKSCDNIRRGDHTCPYFTYCPPTGDDCICYFEITPTIEQRSELVCPLFQTCYPGGGCDGADDDTVILVPGEDGAAEANAGNDEHDGLEPKQFGEVCTAEGCFCANRYTYELANRTTRFVTADDCEQQVLPGVPLAGTGRVRYDCRRKNAFCFWDVSESMQSCSVPNWHVNVCENGFTSCTSEAVLLSSLAVPDANGAVDTPLLDASDDGGVRAALEAGEPIRCTCYHEFTDVYEQTRIDDVCHQCLVTTTTCRDVDRAATTFEDRPGYRQLDTDRNRTACLARAEYWYFRCQSQPGEPVTVEYLWTGDTATFDLAPSPPGEQPTPPTPPPTPPTPPTPVPPTPPTPVPTPPPTPEPFTDYPTPEGTIEWEGIYTVEELCDATMGEDCCCFHGDVAVSTIFIPSASQTSQQAMWFVTLSGHVEGASLDCTGPVLVQSFVSIFNATLEFEMPNSGGDWTATIDRSASPPSLRFARIDGFNEATGAPIERCVTDGDYTGELPTPEPTPQIPTPLGTFEWDGIYSTFGECNHAVCCCFTGRIVVQHDHYRDRSNRWELYVSGTLTTGDPERFPECDGVVQLISVFPKTQATFELFIGERAFEVRRMSHDDGDAYTGLQMVHSGACTSDHLRIGDAPDLVTPIPSPGGVPTPHDELPTPLGTVPWEGLWRALSECATEVDGEHCCCFIGDVEIHATPLADSAMHLYISGELGSSPGNLPGDCWGEHSQALVVHPTATEFEMRLNAALPPMLVRRVDATTITFVNPEVSDGCANKLKYVGPLPDVGPTPPDRPTPQGTVPWDGLYHFRGNCTRDTDNNPNDEQCCCPIGNVIVHMVDVAALHNEISFTFATSCGDTVQHTQLAQYNDDTLIVDNVPGPNGNRFQAIKFIRRDTTLEYVFIDPLTCSGEADYVTTPPPALEPTDAPFPTPVGTVWWEGTYAANATCDDDECCCIHGEFVVRQDKISSSRWNLTFTVDSVAGSSQPPDSDEVHARCGGPAAEFWLALPMTENIESFVLPPTEFGIRRRYNITKLTETPTTSSPLLDYDENDERHVLVLVDFRDNINRPQCRNTAVRIGDPPFDIPTPPFEELTPEPSPVQPTPIVPTPAWFTPQPTPQRFDPPTPPSPSPPSPPGTTPEPTPDDGSSVPIGIIAGVVAAVVVLCAALIIAALVMRNRANNAGAAKPDYGPVATSGDEFDGAGAAAAGAGAGAGAAANRPLGRPPSGTPSASGETTGGSSAGMGAPPTIGDGELVELQPMGAAGAAAAAEPASSGGSGSGASSAISIPEQETRTRSAPRGKYYGRS